MPDWSKASVIEWFRQHAGKDVVLRQPAKLLRVRGTIRDVGELDACSADYHTVDFECGLDDVQVSLSFHDDGLSLHVLAKPSHRQDTTLSLPFSILYAELELAPGSGAAADDAGPESGRSPYELLR